MVTVGLVSLLAVTFRVLIQKFLFFIGRGLCWIVGFLSDLFEMVSGMNTVTFNTGKMGERKLLIKAFFGNANLNTIYWGMALIGIVLCIGFAIFAVIRKSADGSDKMKQSIGGILKNAFKGITLILLMNFIISATLYITTTLMDRINYLIVNSQSMDMSYDVSFDPEEYACMAQCLNTIGNYSLSASYNSRYNLNSCYNDIREDLAKLADKGMFDVTYISTTYDEDGNSRVVNTWQSVLQSIYRSVDDISVQQPLDEYNSKLAQALLDAMDILKNDASFEALESYHVSQTGNGVGDMVSLDRMIMLLGSIYGSGGTLSKGSGLTDYLRGPYYFGQKDIFDYSQCDKDFDMTFGSWLYLTVIVVGILFVKEMLALVFNATARIFNMILLYVAAPPIISVTPLDDGGKLKQWTTAFIIQSCGLFGSVISIRLLMLFIPMLFNGDIMFFDSVRTDTLAKVAVLFGALFTARKASGMIVGILADNAGMQAISAGDMGNEARGVVDRGVGAVKRVGGMALGAIQNDWAMAKGVYGLAKGNGDGASSKKENEKKEEPAPSIETGSSTNAQTPPSHANVANIGPNGQGITNRGSFSTGPSGSARDFQTNRRPKLEALDVDGVLGRQQKTDENIQTGNRPTLGGEALQNDQPEGQQQIGQQNNSNMGAPDAQNPDVDQGVLQASQQQNNAQQAAPQQDNLQQVNPQQVAPSNNNNIGVSNNRASNLSLQKNQAARQNNKDYQFSSRYSLDSEPPAATAVNKNRNARQPARQSNQTAVRSQQPGTYDSQPSGVPQNNAGVADRQTQGDSQPFVQPGDPAASQSVPEPQGSNSAVSSQPVYNSQFASRSAVPTAPQQSVEQPIVSQQSVSQPAATQTVSQSVQQAPVNNSPVVNQSAAPRQSVAQSASQQQSVAQQPISQSSPQNNSAVIADTQYNSQPATQSADYPEQQNRRIPDSLRNSTQ